MDKRCRDCKHYSRHSDGSCSVMSTCESIGYVHESYSCDRHAWSGEAIQQAFSVVREAILADEDIRRGFVASIASSIHDMAETMTSNDRWEYEAAELVLQRIVGAEDED